MLLAVAMLLTACGGDSNTSENTGDTSATYKVGICNYVDDASLNQIVENLQTQLEALGKEHDVTFEISYDICNADANVLNQIIANFIADDVDLMVVWPLRSDGDAGRYGGRSDSCGIFCRLRSRQHRTGGQPGGPGANLTGTSDYLDTNAVMSLILAADPDVQTVGLLYDQGQDSAATPIAHAKEFLDANGIRYVGAYRHHH